jgi:hypothetical protein
LGETSIEGGRGGEKKKPTDRPLFDMSREEQRCLWRLVRRPPSESTKAPAAQQGAKQVVGDRTAAKTQLGFREIGFVFQFAPVVQRLKMVERYVRRLRDSPLRSWILESSAAEASRKANVQNEPNFSK